MIILRICGQVLLAVGVTLAFGGLASFFFENVELRFLGSVIADEAGRKVWVIAYALLAAVGLILWRFAKPADPLAS